MAIDLDEAAARTRRLTEAVADIAELPCEELPIEMLTSLLTTIETAQRQLPAIGGRFRDYLANVLHISAADAGARIATAAALSADEPTLPSTAAAARHGLIGAEHVRIIRDTVDKLPNTASDDDREHFDVELAAVAVAERPEVLRREAAMLLAAFDAEQDDPQTRERSRAARRAFTLGPQDADGMSRGRFCLDPETRAYLEAFLVRQGPARHVQRRRPAARRRRRARADGRGHRHPHHRAEESRCGQCGKSEMALFILAVPGGREGWTLTEYPQRCHDCAGRTPR